MINSPNNQLDEFIRETMKNHEVPFNEAHWNEFESKLTTKPRINVMNKWRYSLNIFIGLIVVGSASAFIYNKVSSPVSDKNNTVPQNNVSNSSAVSLQNAVENTSDQKNTSVIDESNAVQKNYPVVINNISDNNTYSIFTSADISNTTAAPTTEINTNKPIGYSVATNNSVKTNSTADVNADKIDPNEIQKQLDLAKNEDKGRAMFPDQFDRKNGAIYKTKESDTIKQKAEKDFNDFFFNKNGIPDGERIKKFLDNANKKMDSGSVKPTNEKPSITPVPTDSLNASNGH